MLINNTRALAYTSKILWIKPIEGADNIELVGVLGWACIAKKGEFQVGDLCVYFEIDSKLPEAEWSEFMRTKNFKVKTMKLNKFKVISQGLALPFSTFSNIDLPQEENIDLTTKLGITYADAADNKRKANSADKYKLMAQRNGKLFSKQPFRWLMRRTWGKKLLFIFFGKKKDKKNGWPSHIASKTDVERVQNMIWILQDKKPFVATEKVDGSSMSVMAERSKFNKINKYVCSRNVVFENPKQDCYYDTNIYFEAYEKYNLGEKIEYMLNDLNLPNIAIQMEVYGDGVQKRNYSMNNGERKIAVFHILSNNVKMPMEKVVELCEKYDLPHVPIIDNNYILPDTIEELQTYVESAPSAIDGLDKEGIVFYDKATGTQYFKFVSPNFLMKYHG